MILKESIPKYLRSWWWIKLKFLQCITVAIAGTDLSNMRHTCKVASNGECDDQPFITFMCFPRCSSLHPNSLHNHWGNWISQASWSQHRKLQTCFEKQTSQYPWNNPCVLVQQITHILGKVHICIWPTGHLFATGCTHRSSSPEWRTCTVFEFDPGKKLWWGLFYI